MTSYLEMGRAARRSACVIVVEAGGIVTTSYKNVYEYTMYGESNLDSWLTISGELDMYTEPYINVLARES